MIWRKFKNNQEKNKITLIIFFIKQCNFIIFLFLIICINNYKIIELKKKNDTIPKNLKIIYKQFIQEEPLYNHTHQQTNKIFWCWFQGEEEAPNLLKACLNSIIKYCKNHKIIIINEKNINKYVHFPHFILNKFKKKIYSKTHFSDLLRLELLIKYGGTWVDSTVLITHYEKNFFNKDLFFFQTSHSKLFSGSSWFLSAEKGSPILKTTRDLLYEFWRKNNHLIHYFLFHFFFKIACDKYNEDYKNIPFFSNTPVHFLQKELYKPFNLLRYQNILSLASIHKLTRKRKPKRTQGLFYNHILKEFLPKKK